MIVNVRDRLLKVGDKCEYISYILNGTGTTYGVCEITEVLNNDLKIYSVTETSGTNPREWIVQDVDEEKERKQYKNKSHTITYLNLLSEEKYNAIIKWKNMEITDGLHGKIRDDVSPIFESEKSCYLKPVKPEKML